MKDIRPVFSALFLMVFCIHIAHGHGEGRPGLHGGVIRMPGAFHTELMPRSARAFDLFLVDMEWKNPSVEKSTLTAVLNQGKKDEATLDCKKKEDRYTCSLGPKRSFKKGDVVTIQSSRMGSPGIPVKYPYPFLPASTGEGGGHAHH